MWTIEDVLSLARAIVAGADVGDMLAAERVGSAAQRYIWAHPVRLDLATPEGEARWLNAVSAAALALAAEATLRKREDV